MTKTIGSICIGIMASLLFVNCGGGNAQPSAPAPIVVTPPPTVVTSPDLTQNKLLTDSELATSPLSPQPFYSQVYADWLVQNHYPIRSVSYDQDFSDLEFLRTLIGNKSIVQLGESSHGTAEFNHVKTRIIKYLHQNMDFNVIAFESGFFDGVYADQRRQTATADTLLGFVFGVWSTNEVYELFRYVQSTQSSTSPLRLAGFDIQISSAYYQFISDYVDSVTAVPGFSEADKSNLANALERYRQLNNEFSNTQSCYQQRSVACDDIVDAFRNLRPDLVAIGDNISNVNNPPQELKTLYITIFAATRQIDDILSYYTNSSFSNIRDKSMADIVAQIRTDIFPGEKIILWAHNQHIAHRETPINPLNSASNIIVDTMGYFLHEDHALEDELFTIGLYMIRGETALNTRAPVTVSSPLSNSIEALAHSVLKAALFIDTRKEQSRTAGNEFLYEPIPAHYWGGNNGSYTSILSDQYDGLIIIDTSSIPSYR